MIANRACREAPGASSSAISSSMCFLPSSFHCNQSCLPWRSPSSCCRRGLRWLLLPSTDAPSSALLSLTNLTQTPHSGIGEKSKAQLPRVRTSQGSWQLRNYPSIHSGLHQVFLNRLNPAPAYRKCKRSSMLLEIHTISVKSWRAGTKISAFCS